MIDITLHITNSAVGLWSSLVVVIMAADGFDNLFSINVPHIQEIIFFSLDYKSYKACLEVNGTWKELLTSKRYITQGKYVFKEEILMEEERLCIAASFNNTDKVRRLLATGMVDVNCGVSGERGETPLHRAAMYGNDKVAQLLIKSGADCGVTDDEGETPMHRAAMFGHKEVAELLIESGASPNVVDEAGAEMGKITCKMI